MSGCQIKDVRAFDNVLKIVDAFPPRSTEERVVPQKLSVERGDIELK